jgi:hypothetical protein
MFGLKLVNRDRDVRIVKLRHDECSVALHQCIAAMLIDPDKHLLYVFSRSSTSHQATRRGAVTRARSASVIRDGFLS